MSGKAENSTAMDVRLRDVTADDVPVLFRHETDPESNQMAGLFPRNAEAFAAHWRKILADPGIVKKIILVDGAIAGDIGCYEEDTGEGMVGYRIARAYWGRGVATRALGMMLQLATRRPLNARVAVHNTASIRVLEKCGFVLVSQEWCPATERLMACEEALLTLR